MTKKFLAVVHISIFQTAPSQRGRKSALTGEDLQDIDQLITAQPDITIDEIIEKQGLSVSNETVRKAVIRLGHVYKKKSFYAFESNRKYVV